MSDRESEDGCESQSAVQWSVFGAHGGQFGPVMVSTDSTVLRATAIVLGAVGVYGGAIWLTLSFGVLHRSIQWVVISLFAVLGLLAVHTIIIEVYSNGVRTANENQSVGTAEDDEHRQ